MRSIREYITLIETASLQERVDPAANDRIMKWTQKALQAANIQANVLPGVVYVDDAATQVRAQQVLADNIALTVKLPVKIRPMDRSMAAPHR